MAYGFTEYLQTLEHYWSAMKLYPLFVAMAFVTVLIPGPGVVMTITNALRYGIRGTLGGIFGIAFGALIVATISSTSLGILLATSALAFTVLKFVGAAYLIYLGIRFWRSPPLSFIGPHPHKASCGKRFVEGLSLQLTNPKAIFFFLSVLPQFIDPEANYVAQFSVLVLTYSFFVVLIHTLYALGANRARSWLTSPRGGVAIKRTGGATFVCFGVVLATTKQ